MKAIKLITVALKISLYQVGRLQAHLEELEASQFVLGIVTNGYKLAFPQPMIMKNHCSGLKHSKFVEESISDVVQLHCVRESISCPIVCSPSCNIDQSDCSIGQ